MFAATGLLTAVMYAHAPAPAAAYQTECEEVFECESTPADGGYGDDGGWGGDGGYGGYGEDDSGYSGSDDDGGGYYGDSNDGPSWDDGYGDDQGAQGQEPTAEELCEFFGYLCPTGDTADDICQSYGSCWEGSEPKPTSESSDPKGHDTGDPCKDFGACQKDTPAEPKLEDEAAKTWKHLQEMKDECDALAARALDARRSGQPSADDWYSRQWTSCERNYQKEKSRTWPFGDPPKPKGKGKGKGHGRNGGRAPRRSRAN